MSSLGKMMDRAVAIFTAENRFFAELEKERWKSLSVFHDPLHPNEWRIEYHDEDGGCYVVIFAGPSAEKRVRAYCEALKSGVLQA